MPLSDNVSFMPLSFKKVSVPPILQLNATAPDGALIGLVGEDGAGLSELLRAAAGAVKPVSGSISGGKKRRLIGPSDTLDLSPVDVLLLDHAFSQHDLLVRSRAMAAIAKLRRSGTTVLMTSHEGEMLRRVCDEVWWVHDSKLAERGEPAVVLGSYGKHIAEKLRSLGETAPSSVAPVSRRGDRRAEIAALETFGENGRATSVWRSGEFIEVRVSVRFNEPVPDPVIGILIRNRIGLDVYGTNSELEMLKLGPRAAGDLLRVSFRFQCDLCGQEYTLTAASHDPDGTSHDWLEEAITFTVADSRYTAGVANLRAKATVG